LGLVEHVTHVEAAGHVGRRQQQAKGARNAAFGRGGRVEEVLVFPVLGPARFDGTGFVRFGEFVGHGVCESAGSSAARRAIPDTTALNKGWSNRPKINSGREAIRMGERSVPVHASSFVLVDR